ncbi:MAG TPA: proprotein convertase P-domain-containing protein, partial [Actinomycetota bacterium]|nr:proprotein convertase P-domain-containing protein [Actinomycetota bacterium]
CQSFSSSGAQAIPDGSSSSSINVPDDFRLGRVAMDIDLDHANMPDLDIALQTPAGNEIVLVTDVGGSTVTDMDVRLDDHAALPPALFTAHTNQMLQPKNTARLAWTEGESSTGTWTLNLKDDVANALTGTLNSWQLILCEEPAPSGGASVYSSNFESDDGGFTHSGTADEWELGLPTAEPITTCNTGTSCWKTDLDSAYDASSSQDLVSPPISLAGLTGPLKVSWAQRYQMDTANNDHFYVEVREVGGANPRTLFEWDGAVMTQLVGSPASFIYESAGWGTFHADISEYAGDNVELRFHLDSDGSTQYAGVAIDDVRVSDLGGTLRNLTVAKNGTGTGTVTSAPAGINCGSDCIETLGENDQVTLSAAAALGSSFTGWSGGGCTGTGQCVVTMDAHKTVTATFDEVTHELTVGTNGSGSGTVVSTPTGIDCGGDCLEAFGEGTQITLTATAESGSRFTGWTGSGCSGTGECVVTMDSAKNVAAAFGLIHDLTVAKNGTGTGLVTSNVAGINCGNDCTETYDEDAQITLTASPLTGSTFSGWSGAGCSGAGQCVVTMSGPQNPTATFTAIPRDLTVNKNGTGTGAVTSSPAGIDCGLDCQQTSNHGSQFTLTANPSVGSSFTGWSGAGCNGTGQCVVNMDADKTVTTTFALARDLTVARDGTGSGSVSSTPTGISCGNDCSEAFAEGTQVTLTTTPTAGSTFGGWSGGGCSGTGQCIVDMSNNQDVTATFTAIPRNLTVSKNGTGSGSISSAPTGIDCGSDCQETLDHGTQITLTAGTSAGSSFAGWTGAGCSGTGQCVVTMDAAKSVTAIFDDATPPSVPAMTALPDFHLNKQIPLSWSASTDSESGVSSYDLQQSTALPSKPFGTYLTVGSYSTTSTTYTGKAGSTYCFKARAVNGEGIASDYGSPEECTSMPLDDGSLKKTGKWETKKASGYYMGTYAKTTKKGVSAEVNVTAKHLALVATKCGSCGSVKVTLNGALLKKISLKSGGKTKMTVIELGTFATAKTGKLKIQTLSSKLVEIDGLGSSPF